MVEPFFNRCTIVGFTAGLTANESIKVITPKSWFDQPWFHRDRTMVNWDIKSIIYTKFAFNLIQIITIKMA